MREQKKKHHLISSDEYLTQNNPSRYIRKRNKRGRIISKFFEEKESHRRQWNG